MIYLASPYSHPRENMRVRRYLAARDFCYHQMLLGVNIFSPIVYGHQFSFDLGFPGDHNSWWKFNTTMLLVATELWVLQLDGWEESVGVQQEITSARNLNLPISYREPLPYAKL